MSKFDNMGKEELRKACKDAGITYGKLNNDGMRAALTAKFSKAQNTEVKSQPVPAAQVPVLITKEEREAQDAARRVKVAGEVVATKSLKIEKNRESRNGVTRPSVGSICRAVWDALDLIGLGATSQDVKALTEKNGWNKNNTSIEYYQWRKFNGIKGRQKKQ